MKSFFFFGSFERFPFVSAWSSSCEWRVDGIVDIFLWVDSDHQRGDVGEVLADSDVSLSDEHSGVVDRLRQSFTVDYGLQSAVHESVHSQAQNVIQLVLGFVQKTVFVPSFKFQYILFIKADPSKILRGSFSSSFNSSLAAFLRCANVMVTLHISLLFFRPYFPITYISESNLSFS